MAELKTLSKAERERFYADWANKETRERFVEYNLRLAHEVAKRYYNLGIDYEELYQTACLGLWKAVEAFRPEKGFQFSSFAMPVMHNEIRMFLRNRKRQTPIEENKMLSLDYETDINGDGDTATLGDTIPASIFEIDNELLAKELAAEYKDFVENYDDRNRQIVGLYMDGMRQADIGRRMGISRSAVSKIICTFQNKFIKRLRAKYGWDYI